ncbi:hypothetical protein DFH06DRAFT_713726 [Mycena polygramma]|nr:hypothetical protein DFH06DRAFT_713726 [Mycena polygramma]
MRTSRPSHLGPRCPGPRALLYVGRTFLHPKDAEVCRDGGGDSHRHSSRLLSTTRTPRLSPRKVIIHCMTRCIRQSAFMEHSGSQGCPRQLSEHTSAHLAVRHPPSVHRSGNPLRHSVLSLCPFWHRSPSPTIATQTARADTPNPMATSSPVPRHAMRTFQNHASLGGTCVAGHQLQLQHLGHELLLLRSYMSSAATVEQRRKPCVLGRRRLDALFRLLSSHSLPAVHHASLPFHLAPSLLHCASRGVARPRSLAECIFSA